MHRTAASPWWVSDNTIHQHDFHAAVNRQVCTTELGEVGKLLPEFAKRGVKVLALSSNTSESHQGCDHYSTQPLNLVC